ncbi:MAG: DNA recombination protein RmuC, partial [Actinomycetota bacterium]
QKKAERGGIPDYTFLLPHGHVVHMDVKFPIDNYRRWLDADTAESRQTLAKQFQRDVRQRVRELSDRAYVDPATTVDYVLLFVPNESVYGFLHEHDETIIDVAIGQKVVLCSPTTLFAVLAVIRQSVDNFLVERRSDEILSALSGLRDQWERWKEPMEKMSRGLCSAQKAFDELQGPRTRQFERQLEKLESVRDARSLAEGDLGAESDPDTPPTAPTAPDGNDADRPDLNRPDLNRADLDWAEGDRPGAADRSAAASSAPEPSQGGGGPDTPAGQTIGQLPLRSVV